MLGQVGAGGDVFPAPDPVEVSYPINNSHSGLRCVVEGTDGAGASPPLSMDHTEPRVSFVSPEVLVFAAENS